MNKLHHNLLLSSELFLKQNRYWLEKLSGELPDSVLFPAYSGRQKKPSQKLLELAMTADLSEKLIKVSKGSDLSLYLLLLTGLKCLMLKYTGNADLIVCAPLFKHRLTEKTFNTRVAIRDTLLPELTFKECLARVRQSVSEAGEHQDYPFVEILRQLGVEKKAYTATFGVSCAFRSIHALDLLKLEEEEINFTFAEESKSIRAIVAYPQAIIPEFLIHQAWQHLNRLLEKALSNANQKVAELPLLTGEEEKRLLAFSGTKSPYPRGKSVHTLFEEQATKTPDQTAIVWEGREISYRELNANANFIANLLIKKGIKKERLVGILLERSPELIYAMLGILKAGGAYLPIDPQYPEERITAILKDATPSLLLTRNALLTNLSYTALSDLDSVNSDIRLSRPRPQIKDFNSLPFPDRNLVDDERYKNFIGLACIKDTVAIQGSRGCPFNCFYCHKIWPKSHIRRSAENIFDEMMVHYTRGKRNFVIVDDIFNLDIKNSTKFFRLIIDHQVKIRLCFPNGVRGDLLTPDYIDRMVEAGTVQVALALETASPRLQKLIGKNLNLTRFRENLVYFAQHHPGVILDLFFMVGFPTETEAEARLTLDFVKSIQWLHFPVYNVLKIYPNTDMERLAVENGISREAIRRSAGGAYHELPETLPFSKAFVRKLQSEFLNEYFLSGERLGKLLKIQRSVMTGDEIIQKYDSYLPGKVNSIKDLLELAGIREDLGGIEVEPGKPAVMARMTAEQAKDPAGATVENPLNARAKSKAEPLPGAETTAQTPARQTRILLMDLSQYFTRDSGMLYDVAEPPLGLMYLGTYLKQMMGEAVQLKIIKSRFDFDSYAALKQIIAAFQPDLLGVRTLSFYKDFFHKTLGVIRDWGIHIPVIAGGPYATSEYPAMLQDKNIDAVVLGEGEVTFHELVKAFRQNQNRLPEPEVLAAIAGLAFTEKEKRLAAWENSSAREIVLLDEAASGPENLPNPAIPCDASALAYVMYTSGSTGRPKGAMIEHRGIVRLVKNTNYITFSETERILLTGASVFDACTFEIWGALLNGLRLYLVSEEEILDPNTLRRRLNEYGITILWLTSPLFNQLADGNAQMFSGLKYLLVGGDVLSPGTINQVRSYCPDLKIINGYGPTENTTFSCCCTIDRDYTENIPIGRPISNSTMYIVSPENRLMPIGITGELCVGGDGLARGYLNSPELTEEKFTANPFAPGSRMYRTGDLARWLPDGKAEFLGRMDRQVKIRGYRIEPGEIEACLLSHPQIKAAVVVVKQDEAEGKALIAYYVPDGALETADVREWLTRELPDYMVPSSLVELTKMPLTANGKIDRKKLPEPEGSILSGTPYEAPADETEKKLVRLWQTILNSEKIGVHDNFFELGGHSLKATTLIAQIHRDLGMEIPLQAVFHHQTVRELAKHIRTSTKKAFFTLTPAPPQDGYPLSGAQKRMYILNNMAEDGTSYNIPGAVIIEGELELNRLEAAFQKLIRRHEALRTSFAMQNGEPVQRIHPEVVFRMDYRELGETGIQERVREFVRPFDLKQAPLFRIGIYRLTQQRHLVLYDLHHIIADAVSMGIFIRDFLRLYDGENLPELKIHYKDFAVWQNSRMTDSVMKKQEAYWLSVLQGEIPVLNLPADHPRPKVQSLAGDRISFAADKALLVSLKAYSIKTGTTLYMLLLTAFTVLLYKYTGQEDILVGTPVAGRSHADLENILGMFVNTLAIRNYPQGDMTLTAYLEKLKDHVLQAFENADYPFEVLVEKLAIRRDAGRNPLFDVMFVMQNTGREERTLDGFKIHPFEVENKVAKFDLTLSAMETDTGLRFDLEYSTKLFTAERISRFIGHFRRVIGELINHPQKRLSELDLLAPEERKQLLYGWNDTTAEYPEDKTLHGLFEAQTEKTPDRIAVVFGKKTLRYRELNQNANQLARILREKGIRRDDIVALKLERSPEMIISILGILKAGGAYLPIDPEYPMERIRYMLEDSGAKILLTDDPAGIAVTIDSLTVMPVGEVLITGNDAVNPSNVNTSHDLAYIIYTSGTTGKPKGAMIEHRNVVRLMVNDRFPFDFNQNDVWTLFHSYCFDFSVWEMYGALLYGGRLVIVPKQTAQDPAEYLRLLKEEGVTVLNQTPTAFYNLAQEEAGHWDRALRVKVVIFGGEALNPTLLKSWREKYPRIKLVNMYGITETTVHVTYKEITEIEIATGMSNIGRPIPTLKTYILDGNRQPVPCGVTGELYIGGDGVGRGYLNRPELTGEKFTDNPFCPGERLYKSGDLARFLANGEMEYQGRADEQVKIRGHRIEPGEIEAALLDHPAVQAAVILAKEDKNSGTGVYAFLVSGNPLDRTDLRGYLLRQLPEYMMPHFFVQVEKLPLTGNGKVDRKALAAQLETSESVNSLTGGDVYCAPRNSIEKQLAGIWESTLGIQPIGIRDNFFSRGGDSIKALRLVNAIHVAVTKVSIKDIYQYPDIETLAEFIRNKQVEEDGLTDVKQELQAFQDSILQNLDLASFLPEDVADFYPASDIAAGMLYYSMTYPEEAIYHDQFLFPLQDETLDEKALENAINRMAGKHEILRTTFNLEDFSAPIQLVHRQIIPDVQWIDLRNREKTTQTACIRQDMEADRRIPFDLKHPLWRVRLYKLAPGKLLFGLYFHHAILDGWSVASLITELANAYFKLKEADYTPSLLKHTYRDFVLEQAAVKKNEAMIRFWQDELKGYKRLNFFRSGKKEEPHHLATAVITKRIGSGFPDRLAAAARQYETGIKTLCFAAYTFMLGMLSYEKDLLVGLIEHNRPECEDGDKILGCFLNTVPVRLKIEKRRRWADWIRSIDQKLKVLKGYNKLPLLEIIKQIKADTRERNPLFDTYFNYVDFHIYNQADRRAGNAGRDLELHNYEKSNTLLDVTVGNARTALEIRISYVKQAFSKEAAERVCAYFTNALSEVVTHPDSIMDQAVILGQNEYEKLTNGFNRTTVDYPRDKTIHQLFTEQATRQPNAAAVIWENRQLSYRELDERSSQVARLLQKNGVKNGSIVGLMLARNLELMVGMLGILKAGCAYLPIDPEYPQSRIRYMLEDSGTDIVLTTGTYSQALGVKGIDLSSPAAYETEDQNPCLLGKPDDLAYLIYTSGSTGNPKGVMIDHRAVVNFIQGMGDRIDFSAGKRILALTTISFDIHVLETLLPLVKGLTVVIAGEKEQMDTVQLAGLMSAQQVDMVQMTPSRLQLLLYGGESLSCLQNLSEIMVGGEAFPLPLLKTLQKLTEAKIYNMYGPTETTVWSTVEELTAAGRITIGTPIANTQILILDQNGSLMPIGWEGELCIAGDGLARGYLHQPELTREKFIPHKPKYYRTGDLARWLPDGRLECLGRIDNQVKIRGYRIETGEIENRLLNHPSITEAAVVARQDNHGETALYAFLVTSEELSLQELREFLSGELPLYMIPAYFIRLANLPATPNGKLDRHILTLLPDTAGHMTAGSAYAAPEGELQSRLAAVWQEVLGLDRIGIDDDFFGLGGDSIKAVQVAARLRRYDLAVNIQDIFTHPSIRRLSPVMQDVPKTAGRGMAAKAAPEAADEANPAAIDPDDIAEVYNILYKEE